MPGLAGHVYGEGGHNVEVDGEGGVVFQQENVRLRVIAEIVSCVSYQTIFSGFSNYYVLIKEFPGFICLFFFLT